MLVCLLKEDYLAVLYASVETLLKPSVQFTPLWNGLLLTEVRRNTTVIRVLDVVLATFPSYKTQSPFES